MTFCDTYVEGAFGHLLHHDVHRAACGHSWCHTYNLGVLLCQLQQGFSEHILELRWFVSIVADNAFASIGVELPRGMPHGDIFFGRCIAMTFLCMQVQQLRTLHVLQLTQDAHNLFDVMTIERTEVADVHTLEDVLLMTDGALDSIAQSDKTFPAVIFQHSLTVQPSRRLEADAVIGLVGIQVNQIFLHAAHRAVDRHVIVVQDNQ